MILLKRKAIKFSFDDFPYCTHKKGYFVIQLLKYVFFTLLQDFVVFWLITVSLSQFNLNISGYSALLVLGSNKIATEFGFGFLCYF